MADLLYVASSYSLREPTKWLLLHLLIKLTLRSILENQINPGIVIEKAIEMKYIGMAQVTLDFYLALKLVCDLGLKQLFFLHDFQSNNEPRFFLSRQINTSKLTLT